MISPKAENSLRIADGLVVIVLGILSGVLLWVLPFDLWLRMPATVVVVLVVLAGSLVLAGRGRGGTLRLTHRRWRYVALIVLTAISVVVVVSSAMDIVADQALAILPALTGVLLAQLFESEVSQKFHASSLSSRDAGIWKRIMMAFAIGGTVASLQAIIPALLGGSHLTVIMAPLAVFSFAIAAAIWGMLRVRKNQLENTS